MTPVQNPAETDTFKGYSRLPKVTLGIGFAGLLVGVLAAYSEPATGYELSLYAQTPHLYFGGVGVAILVSVLLSFVITDSRLVQDGALLLGGLSVTSIVMLPLIRGYYLFVGGDSLTHLGWTRDLLDGTFEPTGLLYPGIHMMTIFVSEVTGIRLGLAQMFVTLAFVLVFVVFVMLCVRLLGRGRWAVPVGLFAGLLLLPNNNVSVHIQAHAITQSLLLLPFPLYLLLRYVVRDGEWMNPFERVTQNGLLLVLASVALILVHPQGGLNWILVLISIIGVQFLARRFRGDGTLGSHRPLYIPTVIVTIVFATWTFRYERVQEAAMGAIAGIINSAAPGDEIAQRTASLSDIGGSIGLLFVKLFLVALVFCILTGLLSLVWASGRFDDRFPERNALFTYLIISLVPLVALFGVLFVASTNTMHFRYLGFIMVPATILGALAISEGAGFLTKYVSPKAVSVVLVVVFLVLIPLPLATVHSTPFIYKPTTDVSEMHYDGAKATFETMDRDVAFAGVRTGPKRFVDAVYGTERSKTMGFKGTEVRDAIPSQAWGRNLTGYYEGPRYIPVGQSDYQQEVGLYRGLRYGERGFHQLDASPAINRVQTNGEYRLYFLQNETAD